MIYPARPASAGRAIHRALPTYENPRVTVTLTSVPKSGTHEAPLLVAGKLMPPYGEVQIGLSSSASVRPESWVEAEVVNGDFTGSLVPGEAGTFYIWAEQVGHLSNRAVSDAVIVA